VRSRRAETHVRVRRAGDVEPVGVGEPDRLLSSFVNGIKRLPCEFGT
jgi:hypothetical protein